MRNEMAYLEYLLRQAIEDYLKVASKREVEKLVLETLAEFRK